MGDERRSAWRSSNHPDASRVERWTIVAVVAVILLLGAFSIGLIAFQNSADTMYARIRTAAEANRTEDVKDVIDDFLTRYPTDPRFNEVDDWRRDIESGWLKSRLVLRQVRSGGTGLEPYEKSFLEGMSSRESKPDEAIKKFQTLVDEYGTDSVSGDATKYVAAAQHQLKRLKKTGS